MRRPILRGRPLRAGLAGILSMIMVGALPAQVTWADALGSPEALGDRLRFQTVSQTLLYADRSGWPAYLVEALWAAVFVGVLLAAVWLLAVVTADEWTRPVVVAVALPLFAPLANVVALVVTNVGDLAFDTERGENLLQVMADAQNAAGHVMLVAFAGALVVGVVHADRLWERGPDGEVVVSRRTLLLLLRGPMDTLWPRIGVAVVAALAGYVAMRVAPELLSRGFEPVARLWCLGERGEAGCVRSLVGTVGDGPPDLAALVLDSGRRWFLRLYALQVFLLVFALAWFQLRTQPLRTGPATTLLAAWLAYTLAVVTHVGVLDAGLGAQDQPGPAGVLGLLVPPSGLASTVFTAPVVAAGFAAVHAAARAVVARRRGQPSQPGLTSPAS
ncbi:hypothetical protein [Jiangella asiatica]|uniref:Uncharacterized protein n=1 Tax=Jiangella asiatica TaxID=2530372 RepID=A0A4V2YZQ9_9ACTN|nr:hypothetical protein [Jiangella asiatica]TDD98077.1 hypothetical protein E1269_29280 [Jiangella asiatica]